ncbi:adenosylcobinamide-GDP ribazoletransferase [Sulfuriflexus mobilis]|uniref:adenosylcobinamide-GDP ribazoletransferase n=1 Tax=Sulfuriflexus mobilis TaxID=1811807 RepID=UPI001E3F3E49|nr:adenosylcobinamide-GDP ribazoletransferase [Sulfuriflexus mobilis]
MIRPLLIALQFLTSVPVRMASEPDETGIARSLGYYPLVGLLIGILLAALAWVLSDIPVLLSAGLLLVAWVFVTGGLHLDGLADSADAWVGGLGDREKTLAIMKDPYAGPAGVVGIVLLLLIKFAALHAVLVAGDLTVLLLAPVLGRAVLLVLFLTTPYVRANGLGAAMAAGLPRRAVIVVVVLSLAVVLFLAGIDGLWLVLAVMLVFIVLRTGVMRRIGGITGDVAGALVEITEATILVTAILID